MPIILQFLPEQDLPEPTDLTGMAAALEDLLERLKLGEISQLEPVMATGKIDPARADEVAGTVCLPGFTPR